ncbi:hypothetical protein P8C59_000473 [Phyllachora maydis]|uniref:Uncharacterized protein n=1 Tax=Phyllachora maydis TaxID=1825666 RepID=A0AAD9HXR2_9PEZI|nr:hypothetical protein P8C59_000473 [Phyllachora maydis]
MGQSCTRPTSRVPTSRTSTRGSRRGSLTLRPCRWQQSPAHFLCPCGGCISITQSDDWPGKTWAGPVLQRLCGCAAVPSAIRCMLQMVLSSRPINLTDDN